MIRPVTIVPWKKLIKGLKLLTFTPYYGSSSLSFKINLSERTYPSRYFPIIILSYEFIAILGYR